MTPSQPEGSRPVAELAASLRKAYQAGVRVQPEDQLKRPVSSLLEQIGNDSGRAIVIRPEPQIENLGARPDLGVWSGDLLIGYVELKAPGKGAHPERFTGPDREQWNKFKALPNLIYTDGLSWSLRRTGQLQGRVVDALDKSFAVATLSKETEAAIHGMVLDFLSWKPIAPRSPKELGELLAPITRMIREDVLRAVKQEDSKLTSMASEWRQFLFHEATNAEFADAYAQTLTYALLLARFEGAKSLEADAASKTLRRRHNLLAQVLRVLSEPGIENEIGLGVDLLGRLLDVVDPEVLSRGGQDPWLYFYEDFLAAYDPKLRKDRGAYYTPLEVIKAQCSLVADILRNEFGKLLLFADDDVTIIDPAAGTGAYLLSALEMSVTAVSERFGPGGVAARMQQLGENLNGFELLVGPYAVAHLRLTQAMEKHGAQLGPNGVRVFLADTLETPSEEPKSQIKIPTMLQPLAAERREAARIKRQVPIFVCIGNPPYDRQSTTRGAVAAKRKGGWVRFGEDGTGKSAILQGFLKPVRDMGGSAHLKNLYNDYVYFWRWAIWKVLEVSSGPGIVSFITASSYLQGPAFAGMRQVMRQEFDELYILDLEGSSRDPNKTENVFAIRVPVAIAVGVRRGAADRNSAAQVHYVRLEGSRAEKLMKLSTIHQLSELDWQDVSSGWADPFVPKSASAFESWPLLENLFPWQVSGVQMKRRWPIGETREVVEARWRTFLEGSEPERRAAFGETRDRKIHEPYGDLLRPETGLTILSKLPRGTEPSRIVRYGFRSFDRHYLLADSRVGDFMRGSLWRNDGENQVFMVSLMTKLLGPGPAAVVSAQIPDMDYFCNRGGKDVIPLYRNASRLEPNVTRGVLRVLTDAYGREVTAEELFAYVYALLSTRSYVRLFEEELRKPGVRIPITREEGTFVRAAALGRRLINLHTYGERLRSVGDGQGVPRGEARAITPIDASPDAYPEQFKYAADRSELHVGDGVLGPVSPEVWGYSISGFPVVESWLAYRMRNRKGKGRSVLDAIRPVRWTAQLTEELLGLLWVLEASVKLEPERDLLLNEIVDGGLWSSSELPLPLADEKSAPDDAQPTLGF